MVYYLKYISSNQSTTNCVLTLNILFCLFFFFTLTSLLILLRISLISKKSNNRTYYVYLLCFFTFLPPSLFFLTNHNSFRTRSCPSPYRLLLVAHDMKPNRHSCLDSVDSNVWCGVGSDDIDEMIKYYDEEGNPFVVACCLEDYCRIAQHLTNHTLFSVAGLFLHSFPSLTLTFLDSRLTFSFIFRISISFWSIFGHY